MQGSTVIIGTNVVVASDSRIDCSFTLPSSPVGAYDVAVRNLDGEQAILAGGFSVMSSCGAGGLVTVVPLLGLLSLAGLGGLRRKRRGKQRPRRTSQLSRGPCRGSVVQVQREIYCGFDL